MVTSHEQQGLQAVTVEGKGRGITTTIPFKKGDYICSYSSDLLSRAEGIDREQQYSDDVGCYLFSLLIRVLICGRLLKMYLQLHV